MLDKDQPKLKNAGQYPVEECIVVLYNFLRIINACLKWKLSWIKVAISDLMLVLILSDGTWGCQDKELIMLIFWLWVKLLKRCKLRT